MIAGELIAGTGRRARVACVLGTVLIVTAFAASHARAEQAIGLTPANVLISFDTATPGSVTTIGAVTGLGAGEALVGIDVRPATGELYASSVVDASASNSPVTTYKLNPSNAQATIVGQTIALPFAGDVATGYDFDPRPATASPPGDRIRFVNTNFNDENARLNPNNGLLNGDDSNLTPVSSDIIAAAYSPNHPGTAGTLYAIDRASSNLAVIGGGGGVPSPNFGAVTNLASLGFTPNNTFDGGFDVSPSGVAYAALTNDLDDLTRLYTIDLSGGSNAATPVGLIGTGATQVVSIAILHDPDGDGVQEFADNCRAIANADQADLDGDGQGDACDPDQDGDGLSDLTEAAIGSDPRSTNSDRDALGDGQDGCPTKPGSGATGCPAGAGTIDTAITKAPKQRTESQRARIEFNSTEAGSIFECKRDNGGFLPCQSPKRYRGLGSGRHSVRVRSISVDGVLDLTPAIARWRITK